MPQECARRARLAPRACASREDGAIGVAGRAPPDPSGALIWPARRLIVVADLHLEKGSSYAPRGRFIPPYDSRTTLSALERVIAGNRAEQVICLGDSFHDQDAAARLSPQEVATIRRLTASRRWTWIAGNHDPAPPKQLGGEIANELTLGPLVFRHQALDDASAPGELSGHFHPKATVATRSRRITAPVSYTHLTLPTKA